MFPAKLAVVLIRVAVSAAPVQDPVPPARTTGLHDRAAVLTTGGVELWRGERWERLPDSAGAEALCWDRDRQHLLLSHAGRLDRWRVADGERPKVVQQLLGRDEAEVHFPDVHPIDGSLLWTERDPSTQEWWLWTARAGGTEPVRRTPGFAAAWLPDGSGLGASSERISPDGRWRAHFGEGPIVVESEAEPALRWSTPGVRDRSPTFSADSECFAYVQVREGSPRMLVECTVRGGRARRAHPGPVSFVQYAPPAARAEDRRR